MLLCFSGKPVSTVLPQLLNFMLLLSTFPEMVEDYRQNCNSSYNALCSELDRSMECYWLHEISNEYLLLGVDGTGEKKQGPYCLVVGLPDE